MIRFITYLIAGALTPTFLFAQEINKQWHLLDSLQDGVPGMSVERAYSELLTHRSPKVTLVAVIDSGVDIYHEDLTQSIWNNPGEIANNKIDDDKNGYVDDVNGWSFIGGKKGDVSDDTAELTRVFARLHAQFASFEGKKIPRRYKQKYAYYKTIQAQYESQKKKNDEQYEMVEKLYRLLSTGLDSTRKTLNRDSISFSDVEKLQSDDPAIIFTQSFLKNSPLVGESPDDVLDQLKAGYDQYRSAAEYAYNTDFNPRTIVGDDYENVTEKYYGNNHVVGPDPTHGTHVSGIIGANRNNTLGIKGIANHVKIMVIRAVPNGDERDKDVANAIRYAVDNGAKVINMSFGKSYSPRKKAVDKAVMYAEKKGVLLVHAAGNDGRNVDTRPTYPSATFKNKKKAQSWIEVGASTSTVDQLAASFSNYGKTNVLVFAPGFHIYSTLPNNKYGSRNGTSMAAPMVSGVAAMLISYFPHLSAVQIKDVLMQSIIPFPNLRVPCPGREKNRCTFSDLCHTGGIINAYKAVKIALQLENSSSGSPE